MTFDPISSPHSIERCAATITFSENIPEKLARTLVADLSKALPKGVSRAATKAFKFDVATGVVTTEGDIGEIPATFKAADGLTQFAFAPNFISWNTQRYVRWKPFLGQLDEFFGSVLEGILGSVSPQSVRLEYADRFNWAGDWTNFDVNTLIKANSPYVAPRARASDRQWHTHCGWFEKVEPFRRLTNVAVEVADLVGPLTPTVGILTMMQDETNVAGFGNTSSDELNREFIVDRLEDLHQGLKKLLTDIIVPAMAQKIGLTA
ncbi:MAG TPA: TIGR04255 family protein [Rhizomicrobium sp.]|nr:TIGR04255 family protein [Rhizomicrobium sp.]